MGQRGRRRVAERFSCAVLVERTLAAYDAVLQAPR
jgi:hypothetical protein